MNCSAREVISIPLVGKHQVSSEVTFVERFLIVYITDNKGIPRLINTYPVDDSSVAFIPAAVWSSSMFEPFGLSYIISEKRPQRSITEIIGSEINLEDLLSLRTKP